MVAKIGDKIAMGDGVPRTAVAPRGRGRRQGRLLVATRILSTREGGLVRKGGLPTFYVYVYNASLKQNQNKNQGQANTYMFAFELYIESYFREFIARI